MRALLITTLLLLLPSVALATPISLILNNGTEGGFQFSVLTTGSSACEHIVVDGNPVEFCKTGSPNLAVSGTLSADLTAGVISNITGTIVVAGGTDIIVTDGTIDFAASGPDEWAAELVTSNYGTFSFLDHTFAGTANSSDGTNVRLWGNNWDVGDRPATDHWGIDLGMLVVPEPNSLILASVGLVALARSGRRRF